MQGVWIRKKAELARSHEQKIYRKLLVTLRMKSTYELQVLIVHLKCLQQIFIFIKAVTQIVLGNRRELLHHLISQQEQRPTSKTKREIFKNYFFFFTKSKNFLYQTSVTWSTKMAMLIWKTMKSRVSFRKNCYNWDKKVITLC